MQNDKAFRGLPAGSSILNSRQQEKMGSYVDENLDHIMDRARAQLLKSIRAGLNSEQELRRITEEEGTGLSYEQRLWLIREIQNEIQGYGPLTELIERKGVYREISDILVINHQRIRYQLKGRWFTHRRDGKPVSFRSENHLRIVIEKLCREGNTRVDEAKPEAVFYVNGMRITTVIAPKSAQGAFLSIRCFAWVPTLDELVQTNALSAEAAVFMQCLSRGKRNIAFIGGMGTGKTTMLATMSHYWDADEHPVLIEETEECPLQHPNLRRLVSRPPNIEGYGQITIADNLRTALTSMASRVIISEIKGGEAFYVLQAMNIGHDGTMFTFHASSIHDAVEKRLVSMILMSPEISDYFNPSLLIANSLHYLVLLERNEVGNRQVNEISEVTYDGFNAAVTPVFTRQTGILAATGYVPAEHIEIMSGYGVQVPREIFLKTKLTVS